jgi:LPXTG-motif cell wall-anchored protein
MKLHLKPISKRLFSLLLAVVLVLGLPSQAMAATNVGSSETTATQPTDATEPVSTEASDPTEPSGTLETTEPAATEETESEPTDTPTTPDVTEPEATETPTEPTEPLTPEEQDMIRWAELEAQLPDPIEEYFPFAPEIKYPYGEPQDNFYPSSLFEADPYALMPLADMSAIPDNMYDNSILRALAYTGYDVQWLKDNGFLYVAEYVSSNINNYRPEVLSDIGYDDYAPFLNGDETVADSSTVTGRAPDIASFESSGLVCASFVSYYINNYLPNIEGYDTSHIHEAIKATTATSTGYSTASVWSWETGLTNLANTPGSGVTKYTNETEGYANLVPGDIIVFSRDGELVHVAIYAGTYSMWNIRGTNRGEKHFIIHVGNSRGPEISTTEYLAKSGTAKSSVATAWYHLELGSVVDQVGFIEVYKKDPNGKNLSGAKFKAVDQDTGDTFYIGPTDANGYAKSGEMPMGTYVVTETVFPDGYQASGQTSWTVTLTKDTPNMTVTINAVNELKSGSAKIVKATTNGGSKAGWHFEVKNSSGTVIGNYVTDSTGIITLDLEPGTYTVTETDGTYKYWVNDPNPTRTVTVKANETATVTFTNQWRGQAQIVKTTTNGGTVAGWHFTVKNSSGTVIGNYVTDSTGIITLDLEPGTYTVTETDGAKQYWENDPNPTRTVTVKAGETAKVTFKNQYKGAAQIIKTTTNGGTVAGWHFTVKNSSGTVIGNYETDSTGIITLNLEPGTYPVTEADGDSQYWQNDPNPTKTVTVKAGETAKVTFKNQYRGAAQIIKATTNGGTVAGWHFEVKNSSGTVIGNYVTDSTGIITLNLEPGTYTVTETDGESQYWQNDPNPTKTVTVKAGQTAKVTFTNKYQGEAQIVKTTTNGGTVAGWHFEVKNSSGTVIGNYVTDSTGIIALALEPGTYTVTETDGEKEYWENDANPTKTVTVKAGQTAKVTFTNKWVGKAKVIKTATNGGSVEGWTFTIKNASGTFVGKYTTDKNGLIAVNLEPGTYTVQETPVDDPYWVCDTEVKTITVKAGETASVSFRNEYVGRAKIIKTLEDPDSGTVEGWTFEVKASDGTLIGTYKTGADGTIVCDLIPGTYTVTEILDENFYWECVTNISQTVTVKGGQTAEVTFKNVLRPADILVYKVDVLGAPLAEAEFLLEWSEDGTNWQPVTYTDSENVTKGACTSVGLVDGKLVSGRDGVVHFTGLHPELQYRLTETKAPEGYHLLGEPAYEGGITPDETLTVELTVVNAPVFELPMTGSTGSTVATVLQIAGALVLLTALLYIVKKRR